MIRKKARENAKIYFTSSVMSGHNELKAAKFFGKKTKEKKRILLGNSNVLHSMGVCMCGGSCKQGTCERVCLAPGCVLMS